MKKGDAAPRAATVEDWAHVFRDVPPADIPLAAMALAETRMTAALGEVDALIGELSALHARMANRRKRGAEWLAEIERWFEIHAAAARWYARDAADREAAARVAERASRLEGVRVSSFGDPAWRRSLGFPDEREEEEEQGAAAPNKPAA